MNNINIELSEDQLKAIIGVLREFISKSYIDNVYVDMDIIKIQFYEQILIDLYRELKKGDSNENN